MTDNIRTALATKEGREKERRGALQMIGVSEPILKSWVEAYLAALDLLDQQQPEPAAWLDAPDGPGEKWYWESEYTDPESFGIKDEEFVRVMTGYSVARPALITDDEDVLSVYGIEGAFAIYRFQGRCWEELYPKSKYKLMNDQPAPWLDAPDGPGYYWVYVPTRGIRFAAVGVEDSPIKIFGFEHEVWQLTAKKLRFKWLGPITPPAPPEEV